jgi:putative PIN family toxin of toxin-antitoxin system
MRVAVDASILVRALLRPAGPLGPVLCCLRDGGFALLFSNAWMDELVETLAAPALRRKYHLKAGDAQTLIALLMLRGEPVFPLHPIAVCPGSHENHLLEIAVTGNASALVTTTSHLLEWHLYQDIPIITPEAFLRLLEIVNH